MKRGRGKASAYARKFRSETRGVLEQQVRKDSKKGRKVENAV